MANRKQRSKHVNPKATPQTGLTRRPFLGAAAASTYLAGCGESDYPWTSAEANVTDQTIVRVTIYPGIGVARVDNSTDTENDFEDPAFLAQLSRTSMAAADVARRRRVAKAFRPMMADRKAWPPIYGDASGTFEASERIDLAAMRADGPLFAQGPGDLTRWMALPWQGDTAFCRWRYRPDFDPCLQTFWPARVPNHVLTESDYATAMDTRLPRARRIVSVRVG